MSFPLATAIFPYPFSCLPAACCLVICDLSNRNRALSISYIAAFISPFLRLPIRLRVELSWLLLLLPSSLMKFTRVAVPIYFVAQN